MRRVLRVDDNWYNRSRSPYSGQADLFGAYRPDSGKAYLVPVNDYGRRTVELRLSPARNNQQAGVRWARDYELASG